MTLPSTPPRRSSGRGAARQWLIALLVALSAAPATSVPASARRLATVENASSGSAARLPLAVAPGVLRSEDPLAAAAALPSAHFRHAESHAADVITFEPGPRVSVPFRPRADDAWMVDGKAPRALPAGHATGRQIRHAKPDARWAAGPPPDLGRGSLPPGTVELDRLQPRPDAAAFLDQPLAPAVAAQLASATPAFDDPDVASTAAVRANGLRREVFGFLPYWELADSSTVLDWRTLSTVAYFSVGCTSSGGLWKRNADGSVSTGWAGWTSARMTSVINRAHEHGTRVVLTVSCFAWSGAGAATQARVLGSSAARATLARQVAAAVRDRGADGVNLDFEPIVAGYSEEFTALVRAVRRELNAIAPGYQLTFDALGSIGNQPIAQATAAGGADAVIIMGYDYRTAGSGVAGSISPLGGPVYDLTDTVRAFKARVPASKVILGVPYYGRAWSTATSDLHSRTLNPARYGAVAEPSYAQAADVAATYGRRWDRIEAAPWAAYRRQTCTAAYGCVTSWRQMYYDDATSLKLRYDLVNRAGLRGAGIWALGYDGARPELRAALAAKFRGDRAGIVDLRIGAGGTRLVTPNGDGIQDSVRLDWTNARSFDRLTLRVLRLDGSLRGTIALAQRAAGPASFRWNGKLRGVAVAKNAYILQLRGVAGGRTYSSPSASPVSRAQALRYGVVVAPRPSTGVSFRGPATPTRDGSLTFQLEFGAPVTGLTLRDIARGGTARGCRLGGLAGRGASWTVRVTGCGRGTVRIAVAAGTVVDAVGNWGPTSRQISPVVVIDRTRPTAGGLRTGLRAGVRLPSRSADTPLLAALSWRGADTGGAGIASYDVARSVDGGTFRIIAHGVRAPSLAVSLAPGHAYRFEVRARDRAGNIGPWHVGAALRPARIQEGAAALDWRGIWRPASGTELSGRAARYALGVGAYVRYTFTGRSIAWVTTRSPGRGQVRVYVDGSFVGTVDTSAATPRYRVVAFSRSWATVGTHTVRLVLVGTPRRPRVDLDAFEVLR